MMSELSWSKILFYLLLLDIIPYIKFVWMINLILKYFLFFRSAKGALTRQYTECLISEAILHGDKHQPTMEVASWWLGNIFWLCTIKRARKIIQRKLYYPQHFLYFQIQTGVLFTNYLRFSCQDLKTLQQATPNYFISQQK